MLKKKQKNNATIGTLERYKWKDSASERGVKEREDHILTDQT